MAIKNNYPREFLKLRDRIIEHIAIEEIVANMHSTGDFPIPHDWMEGAMSMKRWLLGLVEEEVKEERSEHTASRVNKVVRKAQTNVPGAWTTACNEFEPLNNDENTCATCGWRKQNHDD